MIIMADNKDIECCPPFSPEEWDGKLFEWKDKKFVKDKVFCLFYMPLTFGKVMVNLFNKVTKAGATFPNNMCLSDHTSKWNMDVYVEVDKTVPGCENVILSGKFLSRVYEGPYKDTEKWCKDFEKFALHKKVEIKKWYMWYTTCPKCAKKYGKNYVVIVAQVS